MHTIDETVALLRRQTELELKLMNSADVTPKVERDLMVMRRRLGRSPDAVSAQDVAAWEQ